MVGAPAAADAVRRARALPDLRVGLHVVLADGDAVLAPRLIPGLADAAGRMDGHMWSRALRYFSLPRIRRQLEAEIRAQFAAFARSGLPLDHVNVHKHFHLHPTLLGMLLRIGRDYGVTAIRVPDEPFWFAARHGGWAGVASATALKPWVALMKMRLRAAGLAHNDRIFGMAASGGMNEASLLDVIARLPRGVTEIYLHPAAAGHVISSSMHAYRHAEELAALLSSRVRLAIAQAGAARGGYGDLPPQRCRA